MTVRNSSYSIIYLFICLFFVVWLSIDFFYTLSTGETLMLKVSGKISFHEGPLLFVLSILVKVVLFIYSLGYIYEGGNLLYKKYFKKGGQEVDQRNQKNRINKSLKKKRGY